LRVAPGAAVALRASGSDPSGVTRVELWVTEVHTCFTNEYRTSQSAPPLVAGPAAWIDRADAPTSSAPTRLDASYAISASPPPAGCATEWRVRVVAMHGPMPSPGDEIFATIGVDPLVPLLAPTG
jgi:hypothetical protein